MFFKKTKKRNKKSCVKIIDAMISRAVSRQADILLCKNLAKIRPPKRNPRFAHLPTEGSDLKRVKKGASGAIGGQKKKKTVEKYLAPKPALVGNVETQSLKSLILVVPHTD